MKKLCKILTAFVLTFTMVSNVAPQALFANTGDLVSITEMPDEFFRKYIADKLGIKDPWALTKADLANFKDDIDINGGVYAGLKDITGYSLLGLSGDMGSSITIKNTNLAILPKDPIPKNGYSGPDLLLSNNKVGNLATDLVFPTPENGGDSNVSRVGVLGLSNQNITAPSSIAAVRYNTIGEYQTKSGAFDLTGVLIGTDGISWPTDLSVINFLVADTVENGTITSSTLAKNGIIDYANVRKSTAITFRSSKATVPYLSNRNPWSGNISVPLTVDYKQDITVDGGQNQKYGTAVLADGKEYYGYGEDVTAVITPTIDRTTQYVKAMNEANNGEALNGAALSVDPANAKNYILTDLTDVNHIHTKFTHIADIKNITKSADINGKLASEAGSITVSEPTAYSGDAQDANGIIAMGSTKIMDDDSRTFIITPSDTDVYEIDKIIINDNLIEPKDYISNGIQVVDGKATLVINNINEDQRVQASFRLKEKYEVKTEAKVSVTGTDAIIGGNFNFDQVIKNPGENQTVTAAADKAKGYVIETFKVFTVDADGKLTLKEDKTDSAKDKDTFTYDVTNIHENYKIEATFVAYKNITTEVVSNKTGFNDGKNGGSISKDIKKIPLGSNETVKAEAKENHVIETFRVLDNKNGAVLYDLTNDAKDKTVFEYKFENIKQDYHVEVSFLKKNKVVNSIIPNGKETAGNDGIEHGKISDNYNNIAAGDKRVVEITADKDYVIYSLFIDGEEIKLEKGTKTYQKVFDKIDEDHEVKVSFIREYPITTEVTTPGGSISTSGIVEDGDKFIVNIKPDKGYEVDFDTLKNTGGVITKNEDGTVTIVFDKVINPEDIKVGFKKIVEPAPAPTPKPEEPAPAPKTETPTGDTTAALPMAGLAIASLAACGIVLKKRKSNMK